MNAKLHSSFTLHPSSFCLLLLVLFAATPRAPAQSVWGKALSFDGVDDYVQAGAVPLANSSFTIEAWARRDSAVGMDFIVGHGGGGTDQSLHFGFHFGSSFVLGFYDDDLWSDPGYTDTDWHHWAGTYNATNRLRCLYRDGVLVASNTAAANYQGSGALTIGRVLWAGDTEFHGSIDDVRIWNAARSQAEIQNHMSQPLIGAEANLLAYWKLDEGAGSDAADASSHGFNAVLVNGPTWADSTVDQPPPSWGTALSLDGSDDAVTVSGLTITNTSMTIELWAKRASIGTWDGFVGQGWASASNGLFFAFRDDNRVGFSYYAGGLYTQPYTDTNWHHWAATRDQATGERCIYRDGQLIANDTQSAAYTGSGVFWIGRVPFDSPSYFKGQLDDVRIWNKARSQAQIQADMSRPLTGTESNLVAYYRFDEGGGVMAYDASPNRHDGILVNRPLRAPSAWWSPVVTLNTPNPVTNECHLPFVDPTTVNAPAVAIAAGGFQKLALRADGTVAGWANNSVPTGMTNLVAIAAGGYHSLALKAGGTVVGWGGNEFGQTNGAAAGSSVVAVAAGGAGHSLALKADGTVVGWGNNWIWQAEAPSGLANVVAVAAGTIHSLALKADGTVVGWGHNQYGEATGVPTSYWPPYGGGTVRLGGQILSNVVAIAADGYHSLALKADGTVVGWGVNWSGASTIPADATNVVAIAAGEYHGLALKADGTVIGWGGSDPFSIPLGATNVVAIAARRYESLALRADGTIIGWSVGSNVETDIPASVYQVNLPLSVSGTVDANVLGTYVLTYGTTNALNATGFASRTVVVADRLPPVLTLRGSSPLMVNRGTVFVDPGATATDLCAGDWTGNIVSNLTVNTSLPGIYTNTFTATDASGNTGIATRTIVVGAPIVVTLPATNVINDAATLTGTVNPNAAETVAWFEWCSGYEPNYANSTPPQIVGSGTGAIVVSADLRGLSPGLAYRYRLAASNSPWVARGADQLFWAPAVNLHGPAFLTLQLGVPFPDPTTVDASPLAIAAGALHTLVLRADGRVVGWGANWYNQITIPADATNVVAIATGESHSLALKADGRVVGWGANWYNQITIPADATNVVAIATGANHSLALKADGAVVGWGGGALSIPSGLSNVVSITGGRYHSLALKADGTVVGWGDDYYGQTTIPASATTVVAIAAGDYHSLALKADGAVVGWGDSSAGQTSIPANATNVVAIAAGAYFSLALKADGTVIGWGDNASGQTTIPASATNVVAIAAGGFLDEEFDKVYGHSLALRADGTLIGWGANDYGQISIPTGLNVLNLALRVVGTVNTNVLGTYVLNYSTTNASGAVGTATRTVVVATQPIVTTEPVTGVGPTQVSLQGTVNPRASQTWAWFEYGLGANYEQQTPPMPIGNATNAQPFTSQVIGLLPWMTYHYRTVATNSLGRTDGPDMTFTLPGPSIVAPSLSALSDVTLSQGGSTSVWFTVSPAAVDVRVRCSNPVLLPDGGLVLGGSASSRSLSLAPAPIHSGSAQVTVTASDGSRSAARTFTLTVTPQAGGGSSLLQLAQAEHLPPQTFRFHIVDAGTGSTNYAVEYRPALSPTNVWSGASNVVVTPLGGGLYQADTVPPPGDLGFYRVKGFRLLLAAFDSADLIAEEGAGTVGPVVVFNGIYVGTVAFAWTDEQGTTWTDQVQVNGTTAVIPIPASFLSDNAGIGQLQSLTLRLEGGTGFALGATTESTVAIKENDAHWRGVLETTCGSLSFTLTMLQTNGSLQGRIQSEEFGFFPTNAMAQLTFREATFTAVVTNVCLPVLAAYPSSAFTNYLDLRLDAANGPGETNVSPTRVEGAATMASKVPGRSYQDSMVSGTFLLMKAPTAPATNDVPLYPVP